MRVSLDASAIPTALTGAGRYVMELATALGERDDVELTVLTRKADAARWPSHAAIVARAPKQRLVRLLWEQLAMPRVLDGLHVEAHHAPHYTMPERARIPVVVTIHDMTFFDHPEWHERGKVAVFRRAIARAAARADALICVSETTAARFRERFPRSAPVHVAPHGVDHLRFAPAADAEADAAQLVQLGVRTPYIAFVGTLEPRKDVASLIRAFDIVADRDREISLVIAGGRGWGDPGIDAALAAAANGDRVQQLGYVPIDGVPALLRGATAVAYPSRDEGFGLPVLEAMACGGAVVTTADTVMAEVAADGAVLVPGGDSGALAEALAAVLAGGVAIEQLRQRARARAAQFTWAASAERHVTAYRSVG